MRLYLQPERFKKPIQPQIKNPEKPHVDIDFSVSI